MQSRLFAAGILIASLAAASPSIFSQDKMPPEQTAPPAPAQHQRRPLPKPTNLKVLPKDIAPEALVKLMRGYAGALGVECSFCHAPAPAGKRGLDFASDAKEDKGIARTMIAMTQTVNQQFMTQVNDPDAMPEDKTVTCGTCHRGHKMPEHFVPPPEEHHGPPPAAAPPQ
jgi:hypothetical protein